MEGYEDAVSHVRKLIDSNRLKEALDRAKQIKDPRSRAASFLLIAKKALELEENTSINPFSIKGLITLLTDTTCKVLAQALEELARLGYSDIAEKFAESINDPLCHARCLESVAKGNLFRAIDQYRASKANIGPLYQPITSTPGGRMRDTSYTHISSLEPTAEKRCREITLTCPQQQYEQISSNLLRDLLKRLRRVKIDTKTLYLVKCTMFSCVLVVDEYAIKLPPPLISGRYVRHTITHGEISGFIGEAEKALLLDHPNVIKLYDYLVDPPLLVYERADCDLESILSRSGPLSLEETARVIADVCKGLIYIHSKGFIHGDLKPQNVLLVKGRIKIGDLGALVNILKLSRTPRFEFTPRCCAPEQAKLGNRIYVSGVPSRDLYAIDVYQLANLILELLGVDPLSGFDWTTEGLRQRLNMLYEKHKDGRLVELIGRMLSKEPANRPSVSEVEKAMLELATRYCKEVETEEKRKRKHKIIELLEIADATLESLLRGLQG